MLPGRKWLGSVLAVAAVWLAVPTGAEAQASFSAACTPTSVTYPSSTPITCTLTVTTGATEEKFAVTARSPRYGEGTPDAEFATLSGNGRLTLSGPGSLGLSAFSIPSIASCGGTGPGWHGQVDGGGKTDVTIPANSTSFLTAVFYTAQPPWPSASIAPIFEIDHKLVSSDTSTLSAPLTVTTAEPVRSGASGVKLTFNPRQKGMRMVVKGNTEPVLSKKILKVQYAGPIRPNTRIRPVRQAVRTKKNGSFATSFKVSPGRYDVAMAFRSSDPQLADGWTCSKSRLVAK